jgi:excisionase family DNA binding protein
MLDTPPPRLAYSVEEVAAALGLKPGAVRGLLRREELHGRKVGNSWIVPAAAIDDFLGGTGHARTL